MSEKQRCNLCRDSQAMEVDLEKPMYKLVNKLLQRLFDSYKIDITLLGESSCICQECFEGALQISQSLEKWSKAQEEPAEQEKPLEIDDSKAFHVKLEEDSSAEDEEMQLPQQTDDTDMPAVKTDDDETEETEEAQQDEPIAEPKHDFFSVAIAHDGMVMAKLLKDNTKDTKLMCTCCNQLYENLFQIRMHTPMARKKPTYYCGMCSANFPTQQLLTNHEEAEDHQKSVTRHRDIDFRCLRCGATFVRYFDAIRHENGVHSSLEYSCQNCNMHFKYYGSYQKHIRLHNSSDPPPDVYDCNYPNCSRRFRVWKRYVKHLSWHKGQSNKCPYVGCHVKTLPCNYMRHMRSHYKHSKTLHEGKFMELDPAQRVHPDGRKVPYARRTALGNKEDQPVERIKINPDGEFISLPKQIIFQKGRYINIPQKK